MALQDILQKILEEAAKKVKAIEADTAAQRAQIEKDSKQLQEQELVLLKDKKESALQKLDQETAAMARRENKKVLLQAKHDVLTAALDELFKNLCALSDDEYGKILKALFSKISAENGSVLVPAARAELTKKFTPAGLTVQNHDDIAGGFIVKTETFEIDNSFRNLVYSQYRSEIESELAQALDLV